MGKRILFRTNISYSGFQENKKRQEVTKIAHARNLPLKMTVKVCACAIFGASYFAKILKTAVCIPVFSTLLTMCMRETEKPTRPCVLAVPCPTALLCAGRSP